VRPSVITAWQSPLLSSPLSSLLHAVMAASVQSIIISFFIVGSVFSAILLSG
jgi:hypothetical protein